jgi:integrase/recombinase XerD
MREIESYSKDIAWFLKKLKTDNYSSKTIRQYGFYLEKLEQFSKKPLSKIEKKDIVEFKDFLRNVGIRKLASMQTWKKVLGAIRTYYAKYLEKPEIVPVDRGREKDTEKSEKQALTKEELLRLFESIENIRDKAIMQLGYSCGLRVSEICNLEKTDIDIKSGKIVVLGKGGKKASIKIIHSRTIETLQKFEASKWFVKDSKYYFNFEAKGKMKQFYEDKVERLINHYFLKNGLIASGFHTLRRTITTHLLDEAKTPAEVRGVQTHLRHEKFQTTEQYWKSKGESVKQRNEF